MSPAEPSTIRGLEERALNAWPALQTALADGWILRFAEGYTKRANSACPLAADAAPLSRIGPEIEALYARHGQPAIFRLTPLARPEDAAWLAARGYERIEPTAIMTADLVAPGEIDPAVMLADEPGEGWLETLAAGNRYGPQVRPVLEKILAAIRPRAFFATIGQEGRNCACGLAVVERGRVGLFDILVVEEARRRGLGRRLVKAMMSGAAVAGARSAYLQVLESNEAAIGLYRSLGFRSVYGYAYWVRDSMPREARPDVTP